MTHNVGRRALKDNPSGYTHEVLDKTTNEPILSLTKDRWGGNRYNAQVHPDFRAMHGHVLMPHEINQAETSGDGGHLDGVGHRLIQKAYGRHYEKTSESKYHYAGTVAAAEAGAPPVHKYKLHDPEGDSVGHFYSTQSPDNITGSSTTRLHLDKDGKYDSSDEALAKVTHRGEGVHSLLLRTNEMHKNKNKPEPRFVGANKHTASHSSFKTRLAPKEAIEAYAAHLKSEDKTLEIKDISDTHAVLHGADGNHTIHHSDGHLHHTKIGTRSHNINMNTNIIESQEA